MLLEITKKEFDEIDVLQCYLGFECWPEKDTPRERLIVLNEFKKMLTNNFVYKYFNEDGSLNETKMNDDFLQYNPIFFKLTDTNERMFLVTETWSSDLVELVNLIQNQGIKQVKNNFVNLRKHLDSYIEGELKNDLIETVKLNPDQPIISLANDLAEKKRTEWVLNSNLPLSPFWHICETDVIQQEIKKVANEVSLIYKNQEIPLSYF